jgi:peroxiredoxin
MARASADDPSKLIEAEDFWLKELNGAVVSLDDLLEQGLAYVVFWNLQSGAGIAELDAVTFLHNTYRDNGAQVVAISVDGAADEAKVRSLARDKQWPFLVLLDQQKQTMNKYLVRSLPTAYLIGNEDGEILHGLVGFKPADLQKVDEELREALPGLARTNRGLLPDSTLVTEAEDFFLKDVNGITVEMRDLLKQSLLLIVFWNTTDSSGSAALDALSPLHYAFRDNGARVVAISTDGPAEAGAVKAMVRGRNWPFYVLLDPEAQARQKYKVSVNPTAFLVGNEDCDIAYTHLGFKPGDERFIEAEFRRLLPGLPAVQYATSVPVASVPVTVPPKVQSSALLPDSLTMGLVGVGTDPDAVGVVISVSQYKDVPGVEYAAEDGRAVKEYLVKAFGYDQRNIIYLENPTKADLEMVFGVRGKPEAQLYKWVKPGKSDVFVYYTGHGAPDLKTKEAYLVPADANPSYVEFQGYPLSTLYENLGKIPARNMTVVLEACFSGAFEKGMLIQNASPLVVAVEPEGKEVPDNIVLMSSSSGSQVSSWYPEKRHSLFTYYMLDGLKGKADADKDKVITVAELGKYVSDNVSYLAGRLHNRDQTPLFRGDATRIVGRLK